MDNILKPKLSVSTIGFNDPNNPKPPVKFGVGTLAKIVRKNRLSINSLVKSEENQNKKITKIKNILKTRTTNHW